MDKMDKIDRSMTFSKDYLWIILQLATEAIQNDPSDDNAASLVRIIRIHLGVSKE